MILSQPVQSNLRRPTLLIFKLPIKLNDKIGRVFEILGGENTTILTGIEKHLFKQKIFITWVEILPAMQQKNLVKDSYSRRQILS